MKQRPESYKVDAKAAISLANFQIVKTEFKVDQVIWGDREASNDCNLSITFNVVSKEDDNSVFGILFTITLVNENDSFKLVIEAVAEFVTVGVKVDDEFLDSNLVIGNAPAIAFPYLRTYVSNFCQNSGYNPIIIPGFNFNQVKLVKDDESEK